MDPADRTVGFDFQPLEEAIFIELVSAGQLHNFIEALEAPQTDRAGLVSRIAQIYFEISAQEGQLEAVERLRFEKPFVVFENYFDILDSRDFVVAVKLLDADLRFCDTSSLPYPTNTDVDEVDDCHYQRQIHQCDHDVVNQQFDGGEALVSMGVVLDDPEQPQVGPDEKENDHADRGEPNQKIEASALDIP